ncbi:hypothetical protein D7M10_25075 [Pseudomonas fluorescens]|nr:hypothetical protein D7M10_25075 [Pseudomonas fluorescens]
MCLRSSSDSGGGAEMAVYQSIDVLAEISLSQASQLPQGNAASQLWLCFCSAFDLAFDLDLRRPVKPRWPQAGIAQWAPRQGCRGSRDTAMDGRSRRAHGAMPDCGHAEPRRGTEWWGKSVLLTLALLQSEPP